MLCVKSGQTPGRPRWWVFRAPFPLPLTRSFMKGRGCLPPPTLTPPPCHLAFLCPLPLSSSPTRFLFAFTPLTEFPTHRVSWPVDPNPQGAGIFRTLERMKTQVRHSPMTACSNYWPRPPPTHQPCITFIAITNISRVCTIGQEEFQVFSVC